MNAQIILIAPNHPLVDLPQCLCSGDLDDPKQAAIIYKALWWSKLLSIYYHVAIDVSPKHPRRVSPKVRLGLRLRNLERRAKKESDLFWQDIVADEIARRPEYYDLAALERQEASRLQSIETVELPKPVVPINEVLDWLKRNSPMINTEFDRTREMRVRSEELRKILNAMTPEELAAYRDEQHERMKNDQAWQNAFAKEKRQAPDATPQIPEIDIEHFELLPTD